jgi:hypothetical protein
MATKDELQAENERLKEQAAASTAQSEQMLDMLAEMQNRLTAIEASGGAVTQAVRKQTEQDKVAAEWAALKEEFADLPTIEMVERQVLTGDDADDAIRLLDEPGVTEDPRGARRKWKLRWFNLSVEGRAWRAERLGYEKVSWRDLRDGDNRLTAVERKDEYVRRGDRGLEVLYKMPQRLVDFRKKVEAQKLQGLLTSESKLRDHLANGVASKAGGMGDNADQAGTFTHGIELTITKGERESVTI